MTRLTTRSRATAEHIAAAKPFTTSGSLKGEVRDPAYNYIYSGRLNTVESEMLRDDSLDPGIDYVVWSYSTPIAWRRVDGRWRIVAQTFSPTTGKHQGNLYLIPREEHQTRVTPIGNARNKMGQGGNWRVECDTCGTVVRCFDYKPEAQRFAHGHRFNHDHPIYSV